MKILSSTSKRLRVAASAMICLIIGGCPVLAQGTPEAMLAEFSPIRSQKGIKVIGHVRIDTRTGFHGMWHLQHGPKRFKTLAVEIGLHRRKKSETIWTREDALEEFHLDPASFAHYAEFCSREPGDFMLVSPDRRESYYFTVVF